MIYGALFCGHVDQWVDSVGVFSTTTGIQVKNIVHEFSQNVKSEK